MIRRAPTAAAALAPWPPAGRGERVLVLNATGKAGRGVCRALVEAGFDVYGTTRWIGRPLPVAGATAVTCDRTTFGGMLHALETTGARKLFLSTDYFHAAARNAATEVSQGLCALQAAQVCGVEHVVFMGVADAERVSPAARQVHSKLALEAHLRASGLGWSIVRPALFFENLADPAARKPLVGGSNPSPGTINQVLTITAASPFVHRQHLVVDSWWTVLLAKVRRPQLLHRMVTLLGVS